MIGSHRPQKRRSSLLPQKTFAQCYAQAAGGAEGSSSDSSTAEAVSDAAAASDLALEARAGQITADVTASLTRVGRPPDSIRLPFPGSSGPPSVYGWRATQSAVAGAAELAGRTLGLFASGYDLYSGLTNIGGGNYFQGWLDVTSSTAGFAMVASASAAPVAIPVIAGAKLVGPAARLDSTVRCMGGQTAILPLF